MNLSTSINSFELKKYEVNDVYEAIRNSSLVPAWKRDTNIQMRTNDTNSIQMTAICIIRSIRCISIN